MRSPICTSRLRRFWLFIGRPADVATHHSSSIVSFRCLLWKTVTFWQIYAHRSYDLTPNPPCGVLHTNIAFEKRLILLVPYERLLCSIWSFKGQWQRKQLRPPCQAKKVKKVPKANTFYAALVRLLFSFTSTLTRRCTHSSSLVLWLVQSILLRRSPLFAEEKTTGTSAPQQGFCCRAGFVVLAQTQIFTRFSLLCVSSRVFPAGSPQG